MPTDTYKTIYRGQLPNAVATLATATSVAWIIRHISVVNNDTVARTFSLYRNGTTAAYLFTAPLVSLNASESYEFDGAMAVESGGTIAGVASAATMLTIIIDGDEIS